MVLWLIGLGLGDERDITLRGLDAVRGCARVYLEAYTSTLLVGKDRLVRRVKRAVVARRESLQLLEAAPLLLPTPPWCPSPPALRSSSGGSVREARH